MNLLIGTFTIGFILSLLALGVFISLPDFAFPVSRRWLDHPRRSRRHVPDGARRQPALASLAAFDLDSAAAHGITALDAIRAAIEGKPWLPPLPALN